MFFPRAWTPQAVERRVQVEDGREVVNVLERPGLRRRCARRVFISPEHPVTDKIEVANRNGKPLGSIVYEDYRFPGQPAGAEGDTNKIPPYPGRITLNAKDGSRTLQMDVEEIIPNTPIPLEKFEIDVPEGQKILDLSQSLEAGRNPWD